MSNRGAKSGELQIIQGRGGEELRCCTVSSHVIGVGSNVMPGALSSSSTCKRVATLCRKWIAIGSGTGSESGRGESRGEGAD